jgi:alpha-tubulin suppressor-like RCC1 family protein
MLPRFGYAEDRQSPGRAVQEFGTSGTYSSAPDALNSLASLHPAFASLRMSCDIRMEQNFGPQMAQKCHPTEPRPRRLIDAPSSLIIIWRGGRSLLDWDTLLLCRSAGVMSKRQPTRLPLIAVVIITLFASGCDPNEPAHVESIAIVPSEVILEVGDTVRLDVSLRDGRGKAIRGPVTWGTSDTSVAVVSAVGVVRAVREGTAAISAQSGGHSATIHLDVVPPLPIRVTPAYLTAGSGSTTLVITGQRFTPGSVALWADTALPTTYVDSTRLTAVVGAGLLASPRQVLVTVRGARGSVSEGDSVVVGTDVIGPNSPALAQVRLAAGEGRGCAIAEDSRAYCWGGPNPSLAASYSPLPVPVSGTSGLRHISVGFAETTCALTDTHAALCWGANSHGQLGNGQASDMTGAVSASGGHRFADLAVGAQHVCAVTLSGEAYCWGRGEWGELGDGSTTSQSSVPRKVAAAPKIASITSGADHSCGLTSAGEAWCWGKAGRLGHGVSESATPPLPVAVSGGHRFIAIAAGNESTCGLEAEGAIYCWGQHFAFEPVMVAADRGFKSISAGHRHWCALDAAGAAFCWGFNSSGQLGNGERKADGFHYGLTPVNTTLRFRHISAGTRHTCGIGVDGNAYCWGARGYGALGNGGSNLRPQAVAVTGQHSFTHLTTGDSFTCGLESNGTAWCWGSNAFGALGNASCIGSACPAPLRVNAAESLTSVDAGGRRACAVGSSGSIWCWGGFVPVPTRVTAPVSIAAVSTGPAHACALDVAGRAWCWGENAFGALGSGDNISSTTPREVLTDVQFRSIMTGAQHTCAVTAGDVLYCWGSDSHGQLTGSSSHQCQVTNSRGIRVMVPCSLAPIRIDLGVAVTRIAESRAYDVCVFAADASLWCWGQYGTRQPDRPRAPCGYEAGSLLPCSRPAALPGVRAVDATAGHGYLCVLDEAGTIHCWGTLDELTDFPVRALDAKRTIPGPPLVHASFGGGHGCGLTTTGAAWCWGGNSAGQTGDGLADFELLPIPVLNLRLQTH